MSQVYSKTRLRLVLLLLSALALPFVVGTAGLVYYYLKFARIVQQKLSGERWLVPSRLRGLRGVDLRDTGVSSP